MKHIERRIRNIEDKLNIGNGRQGRMIILMPKGFKHAMPEPLEDWITYKEAILKAQGQQISLFHADYAKELEAREKLRQAAEGQLANDSQRGQE